MSDDPKLYAYRCPDCGAQMQEVGQLRSRYPRWLLIVQGVSLSLLPLLMIAYFIALLTGAI